MLIWTYSLYGVVEVVDIWHDIYQHRWDALYLEKSWWGERSSSKPQHVPSLLRTSRQIYAEAIPIFYQHVPIFFRDVSCKTYSPVEPCWKEACKMQHFARAAKGVKSVMLCYNLALLAVSLSDMNPISPQCFSADFPCLQTLTIYEPSNAWFYLDLDKEIPIAKQRQLLMNRINQCYGLSLPALK
jgi:hypothetical protein